MLGIISYKDLRSWDNLWPGTSTSAHNWYIILLGNMYNPTPAINLVIRNLMYLNERTENIRYFIPGVIMRNNRVDPYCISRTGHECFVKDFFPGGFYDTVEWLEDHNPSYQYSEGMDMILLPYTRQEDSATDKEEYDFKHMLWYCLDDIMNQGINLISFMKKAMDVVSEDMSYEETKAHFNIAVSSGLLEAPKIKVSIVKMPEQWKLPEGMRTKELWAIKINVNGESFNIKVGSKDQRMVYVCTLIRQKLGEHIYLHEFFRNSKGQNCKFTKNGSEEWLRKVYNLLFNHPARNFSEWMEKVDDTANRGRSINQGKSQINASLKKLLKGFNMNASKLPVIDTMKDENKDSYYTTILKPENIDIPEEFLSIPLPVEK